MRGLKDRRGCEALGLEGKGSVLLMAEREARPGPLALVEVVVAVGIAVARSAREVRRRAWVEGGEWVGAAEPGWDWRHGDGGTA